MISLSSIFKSLKAYLNLGISKEMISLIYPSETPSLYTKTFLGNTEFLFLNAVIPSLSISTNNSKTYSLYL